MNSPNAGTIAKSGVNAIEMKDIVKTYGKNGNKVLALNGVSLTVETGEFVAILGPSGSGKSTLMNIIGLIDSADSGSYHLDALDISKAKERTFAKIRNEKIGFVFQKYNLIPKYTALYNVALPLLMNGKSFRYAKKHAIDMLEKVGLGDKLKKKPNELSGGQAQRVAIARALIGNCSIILADEPTGALDRKTGSDILDYMKELNDEGKTIIIITHDHNVANRAGRVIQVEDGKIIS